MDRLRFLILGGVAGGATALAFPPFDLPYLSMVSLAPLVVGLRELDRADGMGALWLGASFGVPFFGLLMLWMVPALTAVTGAAVVAYVVVVVSAALIPAASVRVAHRLMHKFRLPLWAALGIGWVAGEWLRGHVGPLSFPWVGLAVSVADHPALLGPAAWLGEAGITFGLVAINAAVVALAVPAPSERGIGRRLLSGLAAGLVLVAAVGVSRAAEGRATDVAGPRAGVAVVTTDYPRSTAPDAPTVRTRIDWLRSVIDPVRDVDLVVLPEAFVSAPWSRLPWVERELRSLAETVGAPFVVGTLTEDETGALRNAVASVGPGPARFLDKSKRVPWVESGFARGRSTGPLRAGAREYPVVICFEAAFGGFTRSRSAAGRAPILNLTSDAWFAAEGVGGWGRLQQIAHLPLRAVENRSSVLRVANRGPTMWLDPQGRVRGQVDEPGVEIVTVALPTKRTPFSRAGHLFGPLCLAIAAFALIGLQTSAARGHH